MRATSSRKRLTITLIATCCSVLLFLPSLQGAFADEGHEEIVLGEFMVGKLVEIEAVVAPLDSDHRQPLEDAPQRQVHFEAVVKLIPSFGKQGGGFVPGLRISVSARNLRTGELRHVQLIPHLNKSDGFHYAQNASLPGNPSADAYTITYSINPPSVEDLIMHLDVKREIGVKLFDSVVKAFPFKPGLRASKN